MSSRLRHLATVNEEIAERGHYQAATGETVSIAERLSAARTGTRSYASTDLDTLVAAPHPGGTAGRDVVEVTGEGSIEAARRLHAAGARHVGVLNFASARNPGGGYLRGARAQEEDLCRAALLYRCLLEALDYYEAHRASGDLRYSHRVIFSPGVPVIRDDAGTLMTDPFEVSFLTSPAPNTGQLRRRSPDAGREFDLEVSSVLTERALRLLAVAARHDVRELVLGAWGCGVFANDPTVVAASFDTALASYGAAFDRIVFAVWDRTPVSANRAAFTKRFAGRGTP